MSASEAIEPTATQHAEMRRLKEYFPYRIVYCAYLDGAWETGAVLNMRLPNRLMRQGWLVWKYGAVA